MLSRNRWSEDELTLALELAESTSWKALGPKRSEVIALSAYLRKVPANRDRAIASESFRSPNSVAFKLANLRTVHPSYQGAGTRLTPSDSAAVKAHLKSSTPISQRAAAARARLEQKVPSDPNRTDSSDRAADILPPNPAGLIQSLRSFGYSREEAIADLVDNSISAGASHVDVDFTWNDGNS